MKTVTQLLQAKGREVHTIGPDARVFEALELMAEKDVGALVVLDGGRLSGIISERDIVCALRSMGPELLRKPVRDLMTVGVVTCTPEDRALGIMSLMVSRHVRHVPVVTDGSLVGMVSMHDLLELRLKEVQDEADAMRSYITGTA